MTSTTPEATAVRCAYPGCENEPRAAEDGAGAKPKYCGQPDVLTGKPHDALTAFRRRQELARAAVTTTDADTEQPVTMARQSGAEFLRQMRDLAGKLADVTGRLTDAAATLGDTGAAEAEIESAQKAAEQRATAAEARAAEANRMRTEADEAATEMQAHLETAQARAREAHERLTEATAAHAAELERIRAETQARIALAGKTGTARSRRRAPTRTRQSGAPRPTPARR